MSSLDLYVDIENAAGQKLGGGPITSASFWRSTARMDRGGMFEFALPADDPKAEHIRHKRIARAYTIVDGHRFDVGAGIIDDIDDNVDSAEHVLRVSGSDLLRELTYRSVLNLRLFDDGSPVTHAAAVSAVADFAPPGWTFTPAASPPNPLIYVAFNGETVLTAMAKVSERSQTHFFRDAGRNLIFASAFTPSGVRAIQAQGDLSDKTCAIVHLSKQVDTHDMITRIYPRGSGNAEVQLTLRATTRVAPDGFVLNATENYVENTAAIAEFGLIEKQIDFRDVGPVENTDLDIQSAANMLFDVALEKLQQRSTEIVQPTYTLQIAECRQLLRPMQSIRVVYMDPDTRIRVDEDLNILEATWRVDADGLRTTDLVLTSFDRWPASDSGLLADDIEQGQVYQALPQLNANSYITGYNKTVDETETAAFRFRFGREVTQLQQVAFDFQLLPLESNVKSLGTETGGAGADTGGPSIDESGEAGAGDTGFGGAGETGEAAPSTNTAAPSTNTQAPSTNTAAPSTNTAAPSTNEQAPSTGQSTIGVGNAAPNTNTVAPSTSTQAPATSTQAPDTHTAAPSTNTAAPATNAQQPNTGTSAPDTGDTGLTTNEPEGGDVISGGQHNHALTVSSLGSGNLGAVELHDTGTSFVLRNPNLGAGVFVFVNNSGTHTHQIGAHTHTIDPHSHTTLGHSHTTSSHSHTTAAHSHTTVAHSHGTTAHSHTTDPHSHTTVGHGHTTNPHSHTAALHSHTTAGHSHTTAGHSHTTAGHSHTTAAHSHTTAAHSHTAAAHVHSLSAHVHDLAGHTHSLEEAIIAIYGIFRADLADTFELSDLEARVNFGAWSGLETSIDLGDGWRRIDLTSQVQNSVNFRPLQASNTLEIRRKAAGAEDKTCQIDAQLLVRSIIQSVAVV